jgi:hypothetical protein
MIARGARLRLLHAATGRRFFQTTLADERGLPE